MRRKVLVFIFVALLSLPCMARDIHRGYRGFFDFNNDVGGMATFNAIYELEYYLHGFLGISTTHGYQFNENLFVGAGLMLSVATSMSYGNFPVFADFRYDTEIGKFKPYADVRLGYNVVAPGVYISPTVGHRFNCGRKANFNLGLGMMLLRIEDDHKLRCLFSLRLGFDF